MVADTQQSSAHAAHFNSAVYSLPSISRSSRNLLYHIVNTVHQPAPPYSPATPPRFHDLDPDHLYHHLLLVLRRWIHFIVPRCMELHQRELAGGRGDVSGRSRAKTIWPSTAFDPHRRSGSVIGVGDVELLSNKFHPSENKSVYGHPARRFSTVRRGGD